MFAAFTRMRKLEEATNGRDEPTPIYLLDELVADAQSGMPEVGLMVEFCVKRLTAKPSIVKQKTLRLIKHFCNKGAHEFRRAMARHSSSVRELTHYKGEPDPLKGDVPNQRVRDAARDALDALFGAESGYAPATPAQPQLTNRIQGFGSTNYSGSGGSGGFSGGGGGGGVGGGGSNEGVGGMLGSGLAMGQSALSKAAGAVSNASSAVSRGVQGFGNPKYESGLRAAPSYSPPAGGIGGSTASPRWGASVAGAAGSALSGTGSAISGAGSAISGALSPRHRGHGSESMLVGQSGGGYDSDDEPSARQQLSAYASTCASPAAASAVADEGELVDRVCAPGGVRATPRAEELRTFVEALAPLDGLEVGRLLAAKMEGPSWQASLRALCALEAVVQQGSSAACGETAVFFQSDPGALHAAAKSPQATVRARARAVLAAIGADTLPEASTATAAATASATQTLPAPEPDLMGNLLGSEEPDAQSHALQQGPSAAAEPLAEPAPASGSDLMELLSGPEVPQQPAAPAAAAAASSAAAAASPGGGMFDGLDLASARSGGLAHPAAASAQQPQDGGSLFGGLALAGPGAAAQQPPSQHGRPPADQLADLFTSLSPGGGSDVAVHGSASSFGSSAAANQQPQLQPAWSPQPQPQHQQQPGSSALPAGGMANGGGSVHRHGHGHGHARTSSGIVHGRTNSGSGAFEDLDIEFRRHKPMGGGSVPACKPSGASGAGSQPSLGAVSPPPHFNMAPGSIMPGFSQPQMAQQQMWQQQAPMQPQQYAMYGQQAPQQYAQQPQYMQQQQQPQPQPQQYAQPQYMQQQMFTPLQPGMPPQQQQQQQQQPPLARPAYGSGASFGSGSTGLGSGLGIGHARTNSTGLTGGSPTASMAREILQQAGVPEGFAPPRPEQQEAAFDFVVDHISQLKK